MGMLLLAHKGRNRSAQALGMLLLAHKGSLELTLSTQHKEYVLNLQISQREVNNMGRPYVA
jgi:hypothetical protein